MMPGMENLGTRWRQIRFNPLRSLTPSRLASALDSHAAGWLREAALIFETVEQREAIVRSVMTKRRAAVARRDWQVITPDPEHPNAEAHKATLEYFYNNLSVTDATDLNVRSGMSGLLRQMMDAVIQRYAVHEIVWKPGPEGLTAELRRVPIYFFENRSGKLRFIGPETRADGMDLEEDGWMVTVADGLGEALSICYMYKRLGIQDALAFSEKFSVPGVLGRTSAAKGSPEGDAMRDSVVAYANEWVGINYNDDGAIKDPIQVIQTPGGSGAMPCMTIAEYMDRMIATLVRGGDASTLMKEDGTGSSVQQDETDALLEDDCALVSETLQIQLDRAVIRMVHGDESPAAYVVVNPPSTEDLSKDLAIDEGLARLGVIQDPEDLAERYGREVAEPEPDEEEAKHGGAEVAKDGAKEEDVEPAANAMDEVALSEWLFEIRSALAKDLQPLGDALMGAIQAGDSAAMQAALKKISMGMPELAGEAANLSEVLASQFAEAWAGDEPETMAANVFNPMQSRDLMGRWSGGGGGGGSHPAVGKIGDWKKLGLSSIATMQPDPASTVSDVVRAKLALERGIPVTDPLGASITFGPEILAHWETEGKPPVEQDRRLRRLSDAVRSVTAPHEVWENPANLQKTYLRKFQEGVGQFTVTGFVTDPGGKVHSYFHDRRNTSVNKRRQGRLLLKR